MNTTNNAWNSYWQQNQLHSCLDVSDKQTEKVLKSIWQQLTDKLVADAKVLDLATGNGAVPSMLLELSPNLQIEAIDKARINPNQHYRNNPLLRNVIFRGNIDISNLPFLPNSFDAITSQFGIEYAGLNQAARVVVPFLKNNGKLLFIIHHQSSEVLKSSKKKLIEIDELLKKDGLIASFKSYIQGKVTQAELETVGESHINSNCQKSDQITSQIFSVINQALTNKELISVHTAESLKTKLESQQSRLKQLLSVAKSKTQIQEFSDELKKQGLKNIELEPVYVKAEHKSDLIAWYISAIK